MRAAADCKGDWPLDLLVGALDDLDPEVRREAAHALGERRDAGALDSLIGALRDPDVAASAAWALGRLGDPLATGPLTAALEHPDLAVRGAAARALGAVGATGAAPDLEALVQQPDTDPWLRTVALEALVELGYAPAGMRPTSIAVWGLGIALLVAGVAAGAAWGLVGVIPFAAGVALLVFYYVRQLRQAGAGGWYFPPGSDDAIWLPALLGGGLAGGAADGGGGGGDGGSAG